MSLNIRKRPEVGKGNGEKTQMEKTSVIFHFPSSQPKIGKSGYGGLTGALGVFHSYHGCLSCGEGKCCGKPRAHGHIDTFLIWGTPVMCVEPIGAQPNISLPSAARHFDKH